MKNLARLYLYLMALPKTSLFNFYYFPFRDAIRLPVFISRRVWLLRMQGSVEVGQLRTGAIKIGFGGAGVFDRQRSRSIWEVFGKVVFKGKTKIGHGSKISVGGLLEVETDFSITAESTIVAHESVRIGDGVVVAAASTVSSSGSEQNSIIAAVRQK